MIYSEPLFNQISRFLTGIGFGFFFCILYVLVVFVRKCFSEKRWAIILQDLIFSFLVTIISFFFMVMYNNGEVRMNLVVGQLTGGLVLYFTAGRHVETFAGKAAAVIRSLIGLFLMPLKLYIQAFYVMGIKLTAKTKDTVLSRGKNKKYCKNPLEKSE